MAGRAPDSTLLGQNHLAAHGIDAAIHEPALTRGGQNRLTWNLRELALPFELRDVDVAFTPLANLLPLAARVAGGPRVVVVNYGLNTTWLRSSPARRRLLSISLRAAAAAIALGRSQRDDMVELMGLDPARTPVVPIGIDERFFAPRAVQRRNTPLVFTIGKDLARDYATFAEAVRGLEARVEIVSMPRNLEGVELPSNARVRSIDYGELRELYDAAACVVVPQRRDGYPYGSEGGGLTALLEAMAMAKAVVATERAILRDYATDGEQAIFVPPDDAGALRSAIERVLADGALAERLGRAARYRVEREFTTRRFAERLAPILRAAGNESHSSHV